MVNDKSIQQVIELEKHAQEIRDQAEHEAEQLPLQAEQQAQSLIQQARTEAQGQAQKLVSEVQGDEATARILGEADAKNKELESAARKNFDRAVKYIVDQVVGGK